MDIWLWTITTILILFGLFGMPSPYGKIGKKVKKSYTWSRGLLTIVYDKYFIKESILESFEYFTEEFENFLISNYTPSFPNMYREIVLKTNFSPMETRYVDDFLDKVQQNYLRIKNTQKIRRKGIFRQTVRELEKLVEDVSKMAKSIETTVKDKKIKLEQEYVDRYRFSAKEFNNFLRYFRSFLDRTHCFHGVEIEHHKLLSLLVSEELPFTQEKVEK
jgi:hypothetical protein